MTDNAPNNARPLTRQEASDAVTHLGWRLVLGALRANVPAQSLAHAAQIAAQLATVPGPANDEHLRLDVRQDLVGVTVRPSSSGPVTTREADIAARISARLTELGLTAEPTVEGAASRSVQAVEIAIDAMDIPLIRPFWKAVMAYADESDGGQEDGLVDPLGQGPAIWFQQLDRPRPQRNRVHFDVSVPHDEAAQRIQQTLAAGGTLLSDAAAPAFWVFADAEGNEACITTWQGRD